MAVDAAQWFYDADLAAPDVALRMLPDDDHRPALALSESEEDTWEGAFARFDSHNRYGVSNQFYTFLLPLTPPVASLLQVKEGPNVNIEGSYWYPAPPTEQRVATNGEGWNFSGESGTAIQVRMQGKPHFGGIMNSGLANGVECMDVAKKVCLTVEVAVRPLPLRRLFEEYIRSEEGIRKSGEPRIKLVSTISNERGGRSTSHPK